MKAPSLRLIDRSLCRHYSSINMFYGTLERAILETLAYSDVFDYPLGLDQIHHYLPVQVWSEQVSQVLSSLHNQVGERDGFYFLQGREKIVETRRQRDVFSQEIMPHALRYGHILGSLPFIRMVALTGSLAVMNCDRGADFDYMVVAAPKRVWTARAFALLLNRLTRLFGHTICPNLIVSETMLEWHQRDLYSARELWQMIPITGFSVYRKLMQANEWTRKFLPNMIQPSEVPEGSRALLQRLLELPLSSKLGDEIERWEMNRKVARLLKQAGFGDETIFNADMCQGNFDRHRDSTRKKVQERLKSLRIDISLHMEDELEIGVI